jgi:hypothetical protein
MFLANQQCLSKEYLLTQFIIGYFVLYVSEFNYFSSGKIQDMEIQLFMLW